MAAAMRMLMAAWLLCAIQVAAAEPLPDPTRPAIDLDGSGAGGATGAMPGDEASRGLQSIIISERYRAAIINGRTVTLGEKTGDSRLVEVRDDSVVLQSARGRRVLGLFPKVIIRKYGPEQQENAVPENTSGRMNFPESAVGGIK